MTRPIDRLLGAVAMVVGACLVVGALGGHFLLHRGRVVALALALAAAVLVATAGAR